MGVTDCSLLIRFDKNINFTVMFGREIIRQLDLQTYLRVHLVELRVILEKKYHQDDEREIWTDTEP